MRTFSLLAVSLSLSATSLFAQNGLHFDGVDDYVQATQPGPLGTASRTVEAWVKQDAIGSQQRVVLDWGDMATGNRFTLNIINGLPRIEVGGYGISSTTPLAAGTWNHLAATYNNNANPKLVLFVNGAQVNAGNPTVTVATSNVNGIIIGQRNDLINQFNGTVDEIRVWNVARTVAQITANKDRSFCTVPAGMVTYYRLDQGTASGTNLSITSAIDGSASSNDGTLYGFDLFGGTSNWVIGKTLQTTINTTANVNSCDAYTSPGGTTYTMTGTYTETLISAATGCDSISTINLTIAPIDTTVTRSGYTLTAQMMGVQYQWLDCDNGFAPIPGALGQNFTPGYSSSYAVQITSPGCVDTSGCWTITGVGFNERVLADAVSIGPNPTEGAVEVCLAGTGSWSMRVLDTHGRTVVAECNVNGGRATTDLTALPLGVYVLEVERRSTRSHHRVVRR